MIHRLLDVLTRAAGWLYQKLWDMRHERRMRQINDRRPWQ